MTLTIVFIIFGVIMVYQLNAIIKLLQYVIAHLASLDGDVFYLAQEQNPDYGICSNCGRKTIVHHVIPKDQKDHSNEPDMFYCHRCSWLSSTVAYGDEKVHFKNRQTQEDIYAANIGPGAP